MRAARVLLPILLILLTACPPSTCDVSNEDCGPGTCSGDEATMLPGAPCISCHSAGNLEDDDDGRDEDDDELFSIAGTVFAMPYGGGGAADVTIRVTDDVGTVVELTSNSAGNFFSSDAIVLPITAEVELAGEVLEMVTPVDSADCNTCHSCGGSRGEKLYAP